jgi:hypothetical protein
MTISELRGELERRGLDLAGSKASLELRLAQAMVQEVGGPDAAGLFGQAGAGAAEVRFGGGEVQRCRGGEGSDAAYREG